MAALAATLMVAPAAMAHGSFEPSGGQGQGNMMGQGYGGMGQGQGQGYGGMGQGYGGMGMAAPLAEDLSSDGVRHMMEHRVARTGNPNLKVGEIVVQDDDTITADVVTQDGSLVRRFMVDRHTGMMRQADMDNMEK
jgi:hypothetical protein